MLCLSPATATHAMAAAAVRSTRLAPVAMAEMTKEDLADQLNPAIGCEKLSGIEPLAALPAITTHRL